VPPGSVPVICIPTVSERRGKGKKKEKKRKKTKAWAARGGKSREERGKKKKGSHCRAITFSSAT